MNKKEIMKMRFELAKELVEIAKVTESVELFQNTFFSHERLKKNISQYKRKIKDELVSD